MRQQIFTVTAVDTANRTVTLNKPLEFDVPVDSTSDGSPPIGSAAYASKVSPLVDPVVGVGFENLAFTQDIPGLDRAAAVHNYGNMAPAQEMHGIVFKWAADSWVSGVRAEMTGSHPIVTEEAYHLQIVGNSLDGAWNKGKGGNGYFRGSRVWDSLYAGNTSRNLRHFTFQWSASGNVVIGNDFDSDLNLHGGWERNNLFENNTVTVPFEHRSANCTTNCGEEGGGGIDASTWFPIWWAAGQEGGQVVRLLQARATSSSATRCASRSPPVPRSPRTTPTRSGCTSSAGTAAADSTSTPLGYRSPTGRANEQRDYSGGHGVDASRTDAAPSLFLRSLSGTPTSPSPSTSVSPSASASTSPSPSASTSPSRSPSASASSSPPATGCLVVTFAKTSTWSTGYGADYTLTNRCTTDTTGWRVEFDLPSGTTVSSSWSSVRTSSGQHHTFTNVSYNGTIKPGRSTSFGFNAAGTGLPANCRVNGTTC